MIIKLRSRLDGTHVRMKVFAGTREGSLALAGDLVMRPDEWRMFGMLLTARGPALPQGCIVIREGDEEVWRALGWDPDSEAVTSAS